MHPVLVALLPTLQDPPPSTLSAATPAEPIVLVAQFFAEVSKVRTRSRRRVVCASIQQAPRAPMSISGLKVTKTPANQQFSVNVGTVCVMGYSVPFALAACVKRGG
jgi:hypothetical protein